MRSCAYFVHSLTKKIKCFYFKVDNQDTPTCQSLNECEQNIADILGPEAINGISGGIDTFAKGSFHPFSFFISL